MSKNEVPAPAERSEAFRFRETLDPETDRGCALMAAAYLDAQLEMLLRTVFVDDAEIAAELLGQSKPLGSFSSRIDMAYAIGLISNRARRDLHIIRRIRNEFGHKPNPISFADPPIASRCFQLYHDLFKDAPSPRGRFTCAVMGVLAIVHASLGRSKHASAHPDVEISEEMKSAAKKMRAELVDTVEKWPNAKAKDKGHSDSRRPP